MKLMGLDGNMLWNDSEEVGKVAVSVRKIMGLTMNLEFYEQ
jgi:hypothetical protein